MSSCFEIEAALVLRDTYAGSYPHPYWIAKVKLERIKGELFWVGNVGIGDKMGYSSPQKALEALKLLNNNIHILDIVYNKPDTECIWDVKISYEEFPL